MRRVTSDSLRCFYFSQFANLKDNHAEGSWRVGAGKFKHTIGCNPGGAQLRAGAVANGQATKLSPGNYVSASRLQYGTRLATELLTACLLWNVETQVAGGTMPKDLYREFLVPGLSSTSAAMWFTYASWEVYLCNDLVEFKVSILARTTIIACGLMHRFQCHLENRPSNNTGIGWLSSNSLYAV
jgi:hypothetical protein